MSSLPNHRKEAAEVSSEEWNLLSSASSGCPAGGRPQTLPRGRFDDAEVIRQTLVRVMKDCGMSRASIADVMSDLLDRKVTEQMLYAYTGDRDDRRWPAEFDRAFCKATGDDSLIRLRAEMSGLRIIDQEEADLLELGRAYRQRAEADAAIQRLNAKLDGGSR